jgi:hypothetical protein
VICSGCQVTAAGGNSIRFWVFIGGSSVPQFDENGYVTATDWAGTLIADIK